MYTHTHTCVTSTVVKEGAWAATAAHQPCKKVREGTRSMGAEGPRGESKPRCNPATPLLEAPPQGLGGMALGSCAELCAGLGRSGVALCVELDSRAMPTSRSDSWRGPYVWSLQYTAHERWSHFEWG